MTRVMSHFITHLIHSKIIKCLHFREKIFLRIFWFSKNERKKLKKDEADSLKKKMTRVLQCYIIGSYVICPIFDNVRLPVLFTKNSPNTVRTSPGPPGTVLIFVLNFEIFSKNHKKYLKWMLGLKLLYNWVLCNILYNIDLYNILYNSLMKI